MAQAVNYHQLYQAALSGLSWVENFRHYASLEAAEADRETLNVEDYCIQLTTGEKENDPAAPYGWLKERQEFFVSLVCNRLAVSGDQQKILDIIALLEGSNFDKSVTYVEFVETSEPSYINVNTNRSFRVYDIEFETLNFTRYR